MCRLMTWQQYLLGEDQTKTIGGYRLHVPCDNAIAVKAGRGLYGEPKYLATFTCAVPCLNGPPSPPSSAWSYQVYAEPSPPSAPAGGAPTQGPLIYGLECDLAGITPIPANQSPLIEYGVFSDAGGAARLVGNHWDFYGPFETYIAPGLHSQINARHRPRPDRHRRPISSSSSATHSRSRPRSTPPRPPPPRVGAGFRCRPGERSTVVVRPRPGEHRPSGLLRRPLGGPDRLSRRGPVGHRSGPRLPRRAASRSSARRLSRSSWSPGIAR